MWRMFEVIVVITQFNIDLFIATLNFKIYLIYREALVKTIIMTMHIISATWKGTQHEEASRHEERIISYAPFISSIADVLYRLWTKSLCKANFSQFVRKILFACACPTRGKNAASFIHSIIIFLQNSSCKWSFPPFESAGYLCIQTFMHSTFL